MSRRTPRHLTVVTVGSGLVTLAVAVTGATPVWLAVGPLLLVILNMLASSPLVRPRLAALGSRFWPAKRWDAAAYRSSLRAELREARFELGDAPLPRRLLWTVDLLRYHFSASTRHRLQFLILALGATLVALGTTGLVSQPSEPFGLALTAVGSALSAIAVAFVGPFLLHAPSIHFAASPLPWLQDEMDAADDVLPLLIFAFSEPVDLASIGALLTLVSPRSRGHALATLDGKLLVTGSASEIARLLDALPMHIPIARRAKLRVGRAEYPQDGTTPEALLSAATARLTPLDETKPTLPDS